MASKATKFGCRGNRERAFGSWTNACVSSAVAFERVAGGGGWRLQPRRPPLRLLRFAVPVGARTAGCARRGRGGLAGGDLASGTPPLRGPTRRGGRGASTAAAARCTGACGSGVAGEGVHVGEGCAHQGCGAGGGAVSPQSGAARPATTMVARRGGGGVGEFLGQGRPGAFRVGDSLAGRRWCTGTGRFVLLLVLC